MIGRSLDLVRPLERVTIVTPLGIRFWDPAQNVAVTDGLSVTTWPEQAPRTIRSAFRTPSGIYAFQGLPGLHDVEYPLVGSSPPNATRFVVQAVDTQSRFLPAVFRVDVPYEGIFPSGGRTSPPASRPPGFLLFSAPTRPAPTSLAVVRAQLVEQIDAGRQQPAAYAVLVIQVGAQDTWYGIADERGMMAALFPYPTFGGMGALSSPVASPPGSTNQRWPLSISVRYGPATLVVPPGSTIPDLRSILSQPAGVLWPAPAAYPAHPSGQLTAELVFGQELTLRTDNESTLSIGQAGSPL